MKTRNSILVAGVSAIALLAAVPASADGSRTQDLMKRVQPVQPGVDMTMGVKATSDVAVGAIGADWLLTDGIVASQLIGADVVTANNEMIGEVESSMVVDGKTAYLVAVDEQLGMGSRIIEIHENHTSVFRNRGDMVTFRIAVDMTPEQVRMQPEYMHNGAPKTGMDKDSMKKMK
ncbi:MAG: PRC-barrel domain-containing protein [Proteobacteria bacterium]|nr:PRC-barrel domain-containing protein [Pseudomonadota bacterium]